MTGLGDGEEFRKGRSRGGRDDGPGIGLGAAGGWGWTERACDGGWYRMSWFDVCLNTISAMYHSGVTASGEPTCPRQREIVRWEGEVRRGRRGKVRRTQWDARRAPGK